MFNMKLVTKNLSWNLVGNIAFALSQWAIIIVITKMGNEYDLGYYTYSLAIISPLILFFSFDLRRVFATDFSKSNDIYVYLLNRTIHMGIAFFIIFIIGLLSDTDLYSLMILLLLAIYKFLEYLSDIIFGYFQQQERIDLIGKSQLIRALLSIILFSLTFYISSNLIISLGILCFVMLIRLVMYDIKNAHLNLNNLKKLSFTEIKFLQTVRTNIPLAIALSLNSLVVNIPRYFLEFFYDITMVGYFSALYYILVASNLFITPITILIAPKLRKKLNQSYEKMLNLIFKAIIYVSMISIILVLIAVLNSERIISLVYNPSFNEYNNAFIILIVSLLFSFPNGVLSLAMITLKKNKIQFLASLVNLISVCILSSLFINQMGVLGAALVVLITRIITTAFYAIYLTKVFKK